MFPNGWPGWGLLLLRVTDGLLLLYGFIAHRHWNAHSVAYIPSAISAVLGVLILLGLWTPVAGIASAATEVLLLVKSADGAQLLICTIALGACISMLGPGAISFDAAIFGRRKLDLPDQ